MRATQGLVTALLLAGLACSTGDETAPGSEEPDPWQQLLQGAIEDTQVPGAVLAVEAPGVSWLGAAGTDPKGDRPMHADDLCAIGSITKTDALPIAVAAWQRLLGPGG